MLQRAEDGEAEEEDDSGFPYRWTPETWDAAVVAFADTAAPKSREPINADNREDILFMALGTILIWFLIWLKMRRMGWSSS